MSTPKALNRIVIATMLAFLASGVATAGAEAHPRGPLAFTGSCRFAGTATFTPPLTNTIRPTAQRVYAPGECSGTLVNAHGHARNLANAAVTYVASEQGDDVSCPLGIDAGAGRLEFQWGTLHFTVSEKRVGSLVTLVFAGARGGAATGSATGGGDLVTAVQDCAGSGIEQSSTSISFEAPSGISG